MRVFSFAQESTRYCNYSKDKFNNELTFIDPCWHVEDNSEIVPEEWVVFYNQLLKVEETYFALLKEGWQPQQVASILPNSLKTELIMTGFIDEWEHFFDLRALGTTGKPHPEAQLLGIAGAKLFIDEGLLPSDYLDTTNVNTTKSEN